MKRVIVLTTVVVLMVIPELALANPWINWAVVSERSSYGYGGCGSGYYGGYGYNGYPSANVRVKYNEYWGFQGGQRSYESRPDLGGKMIDALTTLGVYTILSR